MREKIPYEKIVRPGVRDYGRHVPPAAFVQGREYFCQDCTAVHPAIFMVYDTLFNRVCPNGGIICCECFQKRLGRKLTVIDLSNSPCNGAIKFFCANDRS